MHVKVIVQIGDMDPINIETDIEYADVSSVGILPIGNGNPWRPGPRQARVLNLLASEDIDWDVHDIANRTGMSLSNVYTTCESLAQHGEIQQTRRRPKAFRMVKQ